VHGGEDFRGSTMKIFNRWGNLIYENADYVGQWDGEDNAAGTYFYIYTRNDGKVYNGHVQLVRGSE
jgi:gliding motility-associated-like protein